MTDQIKELILLWLARAGVKVSGPLGWVASLFIKRLLKKVADFIFRQCQKILDKWRNSELEKKDELSNGHYEQTLQDGASEQEQVNASLDLLNGRKPK